jgi:hypothetical protein
MKNKGNITLFVLIIFFLNLAAVQAQLSAPGSAATVNTKYPAFPETDNIFVFCTEAEGINAGALQVQTELEGTKTFLWEKYNPETAAFEFYFSESSENQEIKRAWVFNNWISATAEVTESDCESFRLTGSFLSSPMLYYDLADNTELEVFKDIQVEWKDGERTIATVINPQIFDPPTQDTEYTFSVYDAFGCETSFSVVYESIVTKAQFSVDFGEQQDEN